MVRFYREGRSKAIQNNEESEAQKMGLLGRVVEAVRQIRRLKNAELRGTMLAPIGSCV